MKNNIRNLNFILFFILFASGILNAQTLDIGTDEIASQTTSSPIHFNYYHSYSQVIYLQEDLAPMTGKRITKLAYQFYNYDSRVDEDIDVYISYTSKNSFLNSSDWENFNSFTQHYTGKFKPSETSPYWVTIEFDTPFIYDGSSNIVIAVNAPVKRSWYKSVTFYASTTGGNNRALTYANDGTPFNFLSPQSGSLAQIFPNIRFYYSDLPAGPEMRLSVGEIDFDYIESSGAPASKSLTVTNTGTQDLTISGVSGISNPFSTTLTNLTIPSLSSSNIEFTFSPVSSGDFSQNVTLIHNAAEPGIITLKGKAYQNGSLFQSFEGENIIPDYWRSKTHHLSVITDSYHGNKAIKFGNSTDTLITPKVSGTFSLYAKSNSSGNKLIILESNDLQTWNEVLNTTALNSSYDKHQVVIPEMSFVGIVGQNIDIDMVQSTNVKYPDHDLLITSWTVPSVIKENTPAEIPVSIKNWGKSVESSYTIYLKDGATDGVLAEMQGESINALEGKNITLSWNPQPSITSIYAEVVLNTDEDSTNNKSDVAKINVTAYKGVLAITPSSHNFGILMTDKDSKTKTFTLKNTGIAPMTLGESSLGSPYTSDYTNPYTLNVNETHVIDVTFGPFATPGIYKDTLVINHNGLGGQTKIPLSGEVYKKGDLYEDFNADEFPPYMWNCTSVSTSKGWSRKTGSQAYEGEASAYLYNSTKSDTLISPKLRVLAGDKLSLYAKQWTSNMDVYLRVMYSPDLITWTELIKTSQYDENTKLLDNYQYYEIEIPEAGEFYIGYEAYKEVLIDVVRGPQVIYPDHDLAIKGLTGPTSGAVNNESTYVVTLRNQGMLNESEYSIKLMADNEVLLSIDGQAIEAQTQIEIPVKWTPRKTGTYNLKAVLDFTADENPDNNESSVITVKIDSENSRDIMIGDTSASGTELPIVRLWNYSLSEVIYLQDEINAAPGSHITALGYKYYSSASEDVSTPIRVWIGTTDQTNFSSSMVQASDMTLVYDADYTFVKEGTSFAAPKDAWLNLSTPFTYNGGNIVVMVETNRTSNLPNIYFYENKSSNTYRSLHYRNDNVRLDPVAGIDLDKITKLGDGKYPTTMFKIELPGIKVTGKVTDDNNTDISDASVSLSAGNILYTTTSVSDGSFDLDVYSLDKKYKIYVEKDSKTYTDSISIASSDINLGSIVIEEPSDYCNFTLKVTTVTGESVTGTSVVLKNSLTGMDYTRPLPANGILEYGSIRKGTYQLNFKVGDLKPYNNDALVLNTNKQTLEVELQENIVTPYGLNADIEYNDQTGKGIVNLSWNNDMDAFFDDFENHQDFAISFSPWTGLDLDQNSPVPLDITFPNHVEHQYAIIFNPAQTTPSRWGYMEMMPYSGTKAVAFIRCQNVPNNDWLIAPKKLIKEGDIVSFMAKALGVNMATENFRVAVSKTDNTNPNSFTVISQGNNESVGGEWTKFQYDLSQFTGEEIYIAINYTSVFKQMMFVDDFFIGRNPELKAPAKRVVKSTQADYPEYVVYLDGIEKGRTKDSNYTLSEVDGGTYSLGVKAVYHTGESPVVPLSIEVDELTEFSSITANVTTNNGKTADNAEIRLYNKDKSVSYIKTVVDGKAEVPFARKGGYDISVNLDGYDIFADNFNLSDAQTFNIELKEIKGDPYNLTIDVKKETSTETFEAELKWNQETGWRDGFESYANFTQDITPWITHDLDEGIPYGLRVVINGTARDISFPGTTEACAPIVFNPSATSPAIDMLIDAAAAEGSKYITFFSPQPNYSTGFMGESNDWLISPQQQVRDNTVLRFLMKAYPVGDVADGDEVVKICVSDTDNKVSSFTEVATINPSNSQWVEYEVALAEDYAGKDVYIAFNYRSVDKFMVQLDDVYVGPSTSNVPIGDPIKYEVYLNNEMKGDVTENSYKFTGLEPQKTYKAGVKTIYVSGTSEITEIEFTTPEYVGINSNLAGLKVYPTLIDKGVFNIESFEPINDIQLFNVDGRMVKSINGNAQTSLSVNVENISTGVYYVKVNSGDKQNLVKVIIK